ncbi:avidin/streptavidin family protein [Vibrio genomosp. F10]|uniref:avidin/streptavidin family protein n=1 Tax=Vibrio genomosp. F10 TaxID=723171 RepID=UPI0002DC00A9|nr:avidin/streptavidin family protein [Vibrio genomosp. F10]OEF05493.1 hypothetical protein A1QI_07925 [Vibrio genomosp. F10 str. 9ZB36]
MSDALSGVWENAFGSKMSISVQGNTLSGIYTSHTGSSGAYQLVGRCSTKSPSVKHGQSVAIAIYWKNTEQGVRDNSWHWAGSMSGQLQVDGKMTLTNSIVVSVPFESYQKGNYVDELVFTKTNHSLAADISCTPESDLSKDLEPPVYPIAGKWLSVSDEAVLGISDIKAISGETVATLATPNKTIQLSGFVDVDADEHQAQSIALVGCCSTTDESFSASGMLNVGSEYLTLYTWVAELTTPQDCFMQTRMISMTFKKCTNYA